jgi:hypothetical protein
MTAKISGVPLAAIGRSVWISVDRKDAIAILALLPSYLSRVKGQYAAVEARGPFFCRPVYDLVAIPSDIC